MTQNEKYLMEIGFEYNEEYGIWESYDLTIQFSETRARAIFEAFQEGAHVCLRNADEYEEGMSCILTDMLSGSIWLCDNALVAGAIISMVAEEEEDF